MRVIARIRTDFKEKFGTPRQSGLCDTTGYVIFEPPYRDPAALRGIEGYSHLWLIFGFSENRGDEWHATVRPPRLGGNRRMGVFATRSPYRPNPVGLSSVRLVEVRPTRDEGTVLVVRGADLVDGTPIYDVKPYLPFTDAHPNATGGFADEVNADRLTVDLGPFAPADGEERATLVRLLAMDPRPSYQADPERVYHMVYGEREIDFTVEGDRLTVRGVRPITGR